MFKRLIAILFLAIPAWAGSRTTGNLQLYKPDAHESGTADLVNDNFTRIDSSVAVLSQPNVFTKYTVFQSSIAVSSMSLTQLRVGTATYTGSEAVAVNNSIKVGGGSGGTVYACDANFHNCSSLNSNGIAFPDGTVITSTAAFANPIRNQETLQSGATFYVSSGTVSALNATTLKMEAGISLLDTGKTVTSTIQNLSASRHQLTIGATDGIGINTSPTLGVDLTVPKIVVSTLTVSSETVSNQIQLVAGSSLTALGTQTMWLQNSGGNAALQITGDTTAIGPRYSKISPTEITLNQNVVGPASFPSLNFCNGGLSASCASIYGDPGYISPPFGLYFMASPGSNPPMFVGTSSVTVNAGGFNSNYGIRTSSIAVTSLTSGQCVQTGTDGLLTGTGSACISSIGSTIYAATATPTFPYGLSVTSVTLSSATGMNPQIITSSNVMVFQKDGTGFSNQFMFANAGGEETKISGGNSTAGIYLFSSKSLSLAGMGIDDSGSSSKGRFQFSPDGFTTNITMGCDILGCAMGTAGAAAYFQFDSVTKATIQATTPAASFQEYGCSDCANAITCISTGTTRGAFASVQATNRTTTCN